MREITRFAAGLAGLMLGAAPMAVAQEVTLDFPTWQLEEPGVSDWWKGLIQAFEARHPGAKIKAYQIPFTQYVKQLTVRFAAATPPDIVHLPSRDFASFADQDWLAPLDDLLKSTDIPKTWPKLQADMTWKGATQGVLLMGYSSMLYFNQQILDAAKVAVPKTPVEFLAALQATTNREKGIFGLSSTTVEHPNIVVEMGTWIVGLGQNWFKDGKYDLTNPKVVEAVDMYRKSVGFAPPGTNSATARQFFLDGKTAFLRDGPWVWAALAKAPPEVAPHLKMAELPFPVFTGGASNSLHMPAKLDAKKKDLVWSFIQLAASPEWQVKYAKTGLPAARRDVLSPADLQAAPHLALINRDAAKAENLFPTLAAVQANYNEFANLVTRAGMRLMSTSEPTAQVMANLQRELSRAIPLN